MNEVVEIEHKYVLAAAPPPEVRELLAVPAQIVQRYLPSGPNDMTRRIRLETKGDATIYTYTEKDRIGPRGTVENPAAVMNTERTVLLTPHLYITLADYCGSVHCCKKERWTIPVGDLIFELDHVYYPIELWVLEVEVDDPERAIDVPAVFGEVTEDPTCSMYAIATGAYSASS